MAPPKGQNLQEPSQGGLAGASASKPYFTKSSAQVDLERRMKNGNESEAARVRGASAGSESPDTPYAVEDNDTSAYAGVSPEYMTYANETEKPHEAESGAEAEAIELQREGIAHSKPGSLREDTTEVGGGSSEVLIYPAVSGDNFTSSEVDRDAVYAEREASSEPEKSAADDDDDDNKGESNEPPAPPAVPPVSS